MDADDKQFAVIYPKFKEQGERGLPVLNSEIDRKLPPDAKDDAKEKLAKRQANGAVALLRMNQPAKVWPLLKHSPDPRVRSYLIHRLAPLGADAGAIIQRLDEEPDVTIRRALLLSLGEYGEKGLSPEARKAVLPNVAGDVSHGRRSGASCVGGMALAAMAAGGVAETGQRRVGQGQGAAGEASGRHPAVSHEGQGESRRRSGTSMVRGRRWW